MNHKLELMDQFDDAAFALMMDEYAEAEGERLRAEFEEAMRSGAVPACPPELDEKCRKQIRSHFGRQRRSAYAGMAKRVAGRAVACLLIALGITAALIVSVEALRVPFWQAITEFRDDRIDIAFEKLDETRPSETVPPISATQLEHVPDGYENIFIENENGRISAMYEDEFCKYYYVDMCFDTEPDKHNNIFTETDEHRYIYFNGYKAELEVGEGSTSVSWHNADLETYFRISTDGLCVDDLLHYASLTALQFESARIDSPTNVPDVLPELLSDSFYPIYSVQSSGLLNSQYEDPEGNRVMLSMLPMTGDLTVNTEGCEVEESTLCDYEATYIHGDFFTYLWYDEERQITFQCTAYGFTAEDHLALCEYLAEYYKDVTLPAVSTVIWE